jgi:DnaK suppressor protein
MTRTQFLRQTREQLLRRRSALRAALAGDARAIANLHEECDGDEIDAALIAEQTELSSQMAEVESRELAQIERAIEKIETGEYGRCESCEKAIAPLRLKYLPYATDCIVCARREERRGEPEVAGGRKSVNRVAAYLDDESAVNEVEVR